MLDSIVDRFGTEMVYFGLGVAAGATVTAASIYGYRLYKEWDAKKEEENKAASLKKEEELKAIAAKAQDSIVTALTTTTMAGLQGLSEKQAAAMQSIVDAQKLVMERILTEAARAASEQRIVMEKTLNEASTQAAQKVDQAVETLAARVINLAEARLKRDAAVAPSSTTVPQPDGAQAPTAAAAA